MSTWTPLDPSLYQLPLERATAIGTATYQLPYVFLNGVRVNEHSDCNQGVESKIKDLVTEEWDDPGSMLLNIREDIVLMLIGSTLQNATFFFLIQRILFLIFREMKE